MSLEQTQKPFVFSNLDHEDEELIDKKYHVINCKTITCSVCKYNGYNKGDFEMCYNINNPICDEITVTTPCCQSILCPNCFSIDETLKTVTTNHLFINSVIYVQDEEEEELTLEQFEGCKNNDVQYKWGLYKPISSTILDTYKVVDKNYNSYGTKKIYERQKLNDYDDYTFVHALCECKTCGFQCVAQNYMNS